MTPVTPGHEQLTGLVERVVAAAGLELEGVTVTPAGRRRLVRVVVDAEHGVRLDEVAEVSRTLSAALDEHEGIVGQSPYVLEVTSPGVDRPLTEPRHWRRAVGRLVRVPAGEPASQVEGRVVRADDGGVVLAVDDRQRTYRYGALGPGQVQVEFTRPDTSTASGGGVDAGLDDEPGDPISTGLDGLDTEEDTS